MQTIINGAIMLLKKTKIGFSILLVLGCANSFAFEIQGLSSKEKNEKDIKILNFKKKDKKAYQVSLKVTKDKNVQKVKTKNNKKDVELTKNGKLKVRFTSKELKYAASLSDGSPLPSWLHFDPHTLKFSGKPDNDAVGEINVKVTATDPEGESTSTTFKINILNKNDPPVAKDDIGETKEDSVADLNFVLNNDSDPDGERITLLSFDNPNNGEVKKNRFGWIYVPNKDFNGEDSFRYAVVDKKGKKSFATVTMKVLAVNDDPVAQDDVVVINEDEVKKINFIFDNDYDVDGDKTSLLSYNSPRHGKLKLVRGVLVYYPDANFNGEDGFNYKIVDGKGGQSEAKVYIDVKPINDPPVAKPDHINIEEDEKFNLNVLLGNDYDVDGESISILSVQNPKHGLIKEGSEGFIYMPNKNYNGTDNFIYKIQDDKGAIAQGEVFVSIKPINDKPISKEDKYYLNEDTSIIITDILSNDKDPDGDPISIDSFSFPENGQLNFDNGEFTYTPNPNYNGMDKFNYVIKDDKGLSSKGTVILNVKPVNDLPVAVDDFVSGYEDSILRVNVLNNDYDIEKGELRVKDITNPLYGAVSYDGNGVFSYRPDDNFYGSDVFSYTVEDKDGGISMATVNVKVKPINDAPIVNKRIDDARTMQGERFSYQLPKDSFKDDEIDRGEIDVRGLNDKLNSILFSIDATH